ncbi:MAG: porin [Proteobacteria bacterium]|nr:porin [Pseudomonadota bacterium]
MKRASEYLSLTLALGAFLGLSSMSHAADLGGDCCSDLEERVAELEATTARKGNRKVSLTISGYVAQELTWWDDGAESNAYLQGLGPTQATHVKLTGEAQFMPGWKAGYTLRIQNLSDNPFGRNATTGAAMNQSSANFDQGLNVQMSYWYLQSKDLGKVSIGRQANASKSAAMFTDQSGTQIIDNYTFLAGLPQFGIRRNGALVPGLTWGQLAYCYSQNVPLGGDCDGLVMNSVRYDSPVFGGFSVSASWGEDDDWEIAARYAGQWNEFKVQLGAGYSENTDERISGTAVMTSKDSQFFQAGGYIEHQPTGLFVHAAYGREDNNNALLTNGHAAPDSHQWYVKSGIRQRWTPLGATIVYGDYAEYDDQLGPTALALGATGSKFSRYGGGIAQEIDAAAMTLYLKFQHYDADVSGTQALTDLQGLDLVSVGGLINF